MSILSLIEIKNLKEKPNPVIFYFILSTIISFIILFFTFQLSINDFMSLENNYNAYITLGLLSFFFTIVFYFFRLDLLISAPPSIMLGKKLPKYKGVKLRDCLNHLYLNNKRNILTSKITFSLSLFLVVILYFLLQIKINSVTLIILLFLILIDIIFFISSYYNYKSFYTGVKLVFFMNLLHQDSKMLNGLNDFTDYIKLNQWFEAKSEFLLFIRKNLKEIYWPSSQKLIFHRILEEFREFCVNLYDKNRNNNVNQKIELLFSSLNRVLRYESRDLYEKDFITPLLESLNYFSDLKQKIYSLDKWIKFYIFDNEDFELPIDDQIIQEIGKLKNKLDLNKFRSILKANYSDDKKKEEIYRMYEIFIKEIEEIHASYLSLFLGVLHSQDFKTLLGLIKNYASFLENLFQKKLSKKARQKIYDCYKVFLKNIFKSNKRDVLKENLKMLKENKENLDELEIYIDFSKINTVQVYLDFSIISKLYYPIIRLNLRTSRLFQFEISEIYPQLKSEKTEEEIDNYLKKIAEKNELEYDN